MGLCACNEYQVPALAMGAGQGTGCFTPTRDAHAKLAYIGGFEKLIIN